MFKWNLLCSLNELHVIDFATPFPSYLLVTVLVVLHTSDPYSSTDFTLELNILRLMPYLISFYFTLSSAMKAPS